MTIYDTYEIDSELEKQGKWINTVSEPEEFLITPSDNQKAADLHRRLLMPHRSLMQRANNRPDTKQATMAQKVMADVDLKVFCKCILLDWKNVTDRDGNPIAFSPAAAEKLLSDPALRKLKEALFEEASKYSNFVKEQKEEAEKNSEIASAGA